MIILAFLIITFCIGQSFLSVGIRPNFCTTSRLEKTRPKIVCLPSKCCAGANVMKNWLPFVFGPAFAMLNMPAPVCFNDGSISSSNVDP